MNRSAVSVVLATVVFSGCTAYVQQHRATDMNATRPAAEATKLSSDPKLVDQFAVQPVALKQVAIVDQLDMYKKELSSNGKYDCCVKPGCNECVIRAGECHCRHVVEKNGPCCGECTQAWIEGRGNVQGLDRETVLQHLGCVRELYEKKLPEGETPPGQPHDH